MANPLEHPVEPEEGSIPPPDLGPGRIVRACGHACAGLAATWHHEAAFRQEVLAAVVLLPTAALVPLPPLQRAVLACAVLLVMTVELLNSAIETAIDRISLEHHPLSGRAKDTGSAAVLMSIAIAAVLWGTLLGPWLVGLAIAGVA